ncbi:Uncharacterized membrane protein [Sphingomonas laterariae]|uniref:Uncharacterized membrane protein n=1 Tax=Edaphosphingomonas laterariae TaxID=861865 RepID=A0A239G4T0_9SPHN|nr:DUF979 domain-containing protein [Sphingomonas laterariae]SNS63503.1 Uncharacterized membrane protein [Sphingomonas laterariae]
MIGLEELYILVGMMFAVFALGHVFHRRDPARWRSAGFWGCYAAIFLAGSHLSDLAVGGLVLGMAMLAALCLKPGAPPPTTSADEREASANRLRNRLFIPALAIPAITLGVSLAMKDGMVAGFPLIDPKQVTLAGLAGGALVGLALAMWLIRPPAGAPAAEGRRLADAVGWAIVLPQMLAALGGVFAVAGVGEVVARIATDHMPMAIPLFAVIVYTVGMALFTIVMGNAFAAFPVMTAGIGLPIIVGQFGGDPVIMSAVGMLSGFCGTLLTPMAANYNIVPAAILELPDRNGVIKVQVPTALLLLAFNTALMALTVYPK